MIVTSGAKVSTLLVTLVYLNRVKSRLNPELFGEIRVRERIFLGAIVLATKVRIRNIYTCIDLMNPPQYTEDYPPGSRKWALVARVFTARDISNAESQLLHALDWDLSVTECNVREQMDGVSTTTRYCRIRGTVQ